MAKPYSSDLRGRFVAALDEVMSASAAGRRMRISRATAVRWAATWQKEGRAKALPLGGDRRSEVLEAHAPEILSSLEEKPDLFLREIVSRLADAGVETSAMSVARLSISIESGPHIGMQKGRGNLPLFNGVHP